MIAFRVMKHLVATLVVLFTSTSHAQTPKAGNIPRTAPKAGASVPVIPASQVSREKAWEYLSLTGRTGVMEKAYRARFVDAKGAAPLSEEMKKRHLNEINELLIKMVQKSFSPSAMDSVLVFLKTPGGQRWAEDAADFNDEFRDETSEIFNRFSEEIKEAQEEAADAAKDAAPAAGNAQPSAGSAPMKPAPPASGR